MTGKRPPAPPDDELETAIYDSQQGRRAKSATRRGHHQAVEQPTPTDIDPLPPVPSLAPRERSEPIRVISMKTPAELADEKQEAKHHQVRLRSMADVHKKQTTPPAGLGFLAPPRDPREVRARRVRDYLIWGSLVVIVGCAVMIGVWFLAGS